MARFKCSSSSCGKTFLLPGKILTERKGLDFSVVRVMVEKACCPFCEGLEFEEFS
jgi:hypothetical protein